MAVLTEATSASVLAASFELTGLTPGSTTVTMKYKTSTGTTASFNRRSLVVSAVA